MVKKTVDKSHRQNVKQEVHVKVHIGDHKKHKRRKNIKRHAAPQQGSNNIPPQTHAFTPVYIQSGEAPHLQPQANPLVEAIKGIHEHINSIKVPSQETIGHRDYMEYFTGENPLVRHHSQHTEQTSVPIDNYSTPFSRNNLSLHHTQHGGRTTPPQRNIETPTSLSDSVQSPFVVRNVNTPARNTSQRLPEEPEFRKHPDKHRPQVKNAKGNWIFTDTPSYKKAHPER